MFPLPPPGSQPKRTPVPWDPSQPYKGLGSRSVEAEVKTAEYVITELPVQRGEKVKFRSAMLVAFAAAVIGLASFGAYVSAQPAEQVIKVTAKRFDYTPAEIKLKKGVPVVLEFTSQDVVMGFNVPDLVHARTRPGHGYPRATGAGQGRDLRVSLRHLLRRRSRGDDRNDHRDGVISVGPLRRDFCWSRQRQALRREP